ncbi:MAG TPA: hypothetical protein VLX30_02390 [Burkholderiales bacterium]|nr:hypothetical protein [Burkholderiales bacterium]
MRLDGERAKPAKEVYPGDRLAIRTGDTEWEVTLRAERSLMVEPARELHGRPTKRDRRSLERLRRGS